MHEPLISVVIPVYNVERYLERCLHSVVSQTYSNLEIILVDDGSTDGSPALCDAWAEKDRRITVIHKKNEGLGYARNTGIDCASGTYMCFFDSDDYIAPDTIEQAYAAAAKENADLVLFGSAAVNGSGDVVMRSVPKPRKTVYRGREIREELLPAVLAPDPVTGEFIYLSMSACRILVSRKMVDRVNWRFVSEREIISEDIYSMLSLYQHLECVAIVCKVLYFYCYNDTSLTHTYRSDRYEKNRYCYTKYIELCDCCGYSEKVKRACATPFLNGMFAAVKDEVRVNRGICKGVAAVRRILRDELLLQVLRERKKDRVNSKKRIFFWMIRHRCYFLCYCLLKVKLFQSTGKG